MSAEPRRATRQDWIELLMFKAERDPTLDKEKVKEIRRALEARDSKMKVIEHAPKD